MKLLEGKTIVEVVREMVVTRPIISGIIIGLVLSEILKK